MGISSKFLTELAKRYKKTLLTIVITVLITIVIQTIFSVWLSNNGEVYLPSIGTIYTLNIEVYGGDLKELSNGQKFLDWGVIYPGMEVNRGFNVKSKSNVDAILTIKPTNWTFKDSTNRTINFISETDYETLVSGFIFTSNSNGTLIRPTETLEITLTLKVKVSSDFIDALIRNNVKNFSFDIYIDLSKPN